MKHSGKVHKGIHVATVVSGPRTGEDTPSPRKWLEEMKKRAEAGDTAAQNNLGAAYAGGVPGVKPDPAAALRWLRPLAAQGIPQAMSNLGFLLLRLPGADAAAKAEGLALLRKAAAAGEPQAMCHLGWAYLFGAGVEKDAGQAEAFYRKAADTGNTDGMAGLAGVYMDSSDKEKNNAAFELNRKAAALGSPLALFQLGTSYLHGAHGAPQDATEAAACFKRSAEAGFAPAMRMAGILCEEGRGVPKSLAEARQWYERSAAGEDAEGARRLARMAYYGIGTARNIVKGIELFRQAAALGDTEAQLTVAAAAECGLGMAHNAKFALEAYRKVAESGNPHAMFTLGMIYESGLLGVEHDRAEADRWFRLAADKGHAGAEAALRRPHGALAFHPEHLPLDAKAWVINARVGDPPAMRVVGLWFINGWGNEALGATSREEGLRWLNAASQKGDVAAMAALPYQLQRAKSEDAPDEEWDALFRRLLPLAEKGDALAQNALASVYLFWKNVPSKTPQLEIVKWRRLAAEQTGDPSIENELGLAYYALGNKGKHWAQQFSAPVSLLSYKGWEVLIREHIGGFLFRKERRTYYQESLLWHQKAADKKFASAFTNLGDLWFLGKGVARDEREAFRLYSEGAKLGDLTAKVNAGVMLCEGWGCEKDTARGEALLLEAKNAGSRNAAAVCTLRNISPDESLATTSVRAACALLDSEMPCFPVRRAHRRFVLQFFKLFAIVLGFLFWLAGFVWFLVIMLRKLF